MARTHTESTADMTDGQVPSGTNLLWDIRDPVNVVRDVEAYDERQAYEAAEAAEPGSWEGDEPPVVPHTAVADPDDVKVGERLYVKMRFRVESTAKPGQLVDENDEWLQFGTVNFPTLTGAQVTALKAVFKAMYDDRRAARGLVPAV
jgi:hypothetical protein